MRISEIDHRNHTFHNDDLLPLHIRGLKRIVILAGPNGAGKTRILNRIGRLHNQLTDQAGMEYSFNTQFDAHSLKNLRDGHHANTPQGLITRDSLGFYFNDKTSPDLGFTAGTNAPSYHKVSVVTFVNKRLEGLKDPSAITRSDMLSFGESAETLGVQHLFESSLPYIQMRQNRRWEASHPSSEMSDALKSEQLSKYDTLDDLIHVAVGSRLGRNIDGDSTLFNMPIARASLSEGQQTLLHWAVAIHAQGVKLNGSILLMDEPENHLHPEAMIATVRRIIDINQDGQIWISTHSIPLIAFLYKEYSDEVTLEFVIQGKAIYAGREPEKVLESLMGGSGNIESLREFIDLPVRLAAVRFAAESLLPPGVVSASNADDPQVKLAEAAMFAHPTSWPIKVLDYGAGRGRLLDSLLAGTDGDIKAKLDYYAFDRLIQSECLSAIERVYGPNSGKARAYSNANDLASQHIPNSFDAVVMCGVLHEIDPREWLQLFGRSGVISRTLKPNGSLLIIEDLLIPKGECAHDYGFIVFDTAALQSLFGGSSVIAKSPLTEYSDRIKLHIISASAIALVTTHSRISSLEMAQQQAHDKIHAIRQQKAKSFRAGHEHAFWVQQFANVTLALTDLADK